MSGPYILVDIATGEAVTVGSTRESIRSGDALRWQCTLISIEAPAFGEPFGRVLVEYSDGYRVSVRPSFIGAEFREIGNDNRER